MRREEGRRAFVRNMMIGVPAVAGSASLVAIADAAPAPVGVGQLMADRGIENVLRLMAELHDDISRRVPTKEDAARAGEYIRSLIGHRRAANRDGQVADAFRDLVTERGMATLSAVEPDERRLRAGLTYYGIDPGSVRLAPVADDVRASVIDRIAKGGVEPFYEDLATFFEIAGGVYLAAPSLCDLFNEAMKLFEAMVASLCLGAMFLPPLAPECFAATVALAMLKLISLFNGC